MYPDPCVHAALHKHPNAHVHTTPTHSTTDHDYIQLLHWQVHDASDDRQRFALVSNSAYTCYQGPHAAPGLLAWLTILLHVITFPALTFAYLWYRRQFFSNDAANPTFPDGTAPAIVAYASTMAKRRRSSVGGGWGPHAAGTNPFPLDAWASFLEDDFQPRHFWLAHLRLGNMLLLSLLIPLASAPDMATQGGAFAVRSDSHCLALWLLQLPNC